MQGAPAPWELAKAPCTCFPEDTSTLDPRSTLWGDGDQQELGERPCAAVLASLQPERPLCLLAAHLGETAVGTGTSTVLPNGMALPSPACFWCVFVPWAFPFQRKKQLFHLCLVSAGLGQRLALTPACRPRAGRELRRQWNYRAVCQRDTQEGSYERVTIIPTPDGQPPNFFPVGTASSELDPLGLVSEAVSLGSRGWGVGKGLSHYFLQS